ncbi:MAG TPA: hypothetical protein VGB17_04455 [Pyrinomonadaceae bacterium]|jgi:tetratricopeptide (TPR) repeat protein
MRSELCAAGLMAAFLLGACGGQPQPSAHTSPAANATSANDSNRQSAQPLNLRGPSARESVKPSSSSSSGGGEAIDTSEYDAEIRRAKKQAERKASTDADRQALAQSYLARARALTKARQYRVALGDYRRTLEYDPGNEEARQMAGTIISILQSMHIEVPPAGREPSPLPYKK